MKKVILLSIFLILSNLVFSQNKRVEILFNEKNNSSDIIIHLDKLGCIVEELETASLKQKDIIKLPSKKSSTPIENYSYIRISTSLNSSKSLRSSTIYLFNGKFETSYTFPAGSTRYIDNQKQNVFVTPDFLLYRVFLSISKDYAENYFINIIKSSDKQINLAMNPFNCVVKDDVVLFKYDDVTLEFDLLLLNDPNHYFKKIEDNLENQDPELPDHLKPYAKEDL